MKTAAIALCLLPMVDGCCRQPPAQVQEPKDVWHTTPDRWDQPRVFHTAFDEQWADRAHLIREPVKDVNETMVFSPNGAYWFAMVFSDMFEPTQSSATIRIYNERDDFLCVHLPDIKALCCKADWINEKLLFVSFWLGRALGIDLIVDVEKEEIIYREMTNWGGTAFLQWQQARND